jgi:hypothetical protein
MNDNAASCEPNATQTDAARQNYFAGAKWHCPNTPLTRACFSEKSTGMNITLSRKEFTRLIELVYMGEQVAFAIDRDNGPYVKRYDSLVQKIYALAAKDRDGRPEYVEEDEENEGEFVPSMHLETDSPASNALERYENYTFWEELISRLAERDACREEERNPSPSPEEMFEKQINLEEYLEERYRDEFVKNDLKNIFVMFGSDRLS